MYDYDVVSIGAGSGGCASAMRSSDLGKKVALIEHRDKGTGGTCVNRGCIPTKVLVKSAHVLEEMRMAQQYGIIVKEISADMKLIQQKKNTVVNSLKFGLDNFLIKSRKIDRIKGKAKFIDAHTLEVKDGDNIKIVTAENIIIASGSEPAMIGAFNIDRKNIITSDEALNLEEIPKELIIVGAGALGLEFAYIFSNFGSKVTIAEMMPHVVPNMKDKEITDAVHAYLKKNGIEVLCGDGISKIEVVDGNRVKCSLSSGKEIEADKALVAIGRSLNTNDLGLDMVNIETTPKGQILIDKNMRTNIDNIFAVGDITEGPQLSHKAQKQGLVAAETIAGIDSKINYDAIPWAIFMQPEIAGVGLTAEEAETKGIEVITGKMKFSANEKAMSMQQTTGLIKIVARKDNHQIIGGQIFGTDASVLIEEISLAIENNLTLENVADSIHAHPTLSEIVMESAKNSLGKSFNK